uniref:Uncharacterized protein n=1 Tax=Caenorhabditis japonica TaxID=281687 RepID=A0A8R1EF34_CAEJA
MTSPHRVIADLKRAGTMSCRLHTRAVPLPYPCQSHVMSLPIGKVPGAYFPLPYTCHAHTAPLSVGNVPYPGHTRAITTL